MKKLLLLLVTWAGIAFSANADATPTVISFEDLYGANSVPTNYLGFTWDGGWRYYGYQQAPYCAGSGMQRIYTNNSAGGVKFGSDVTFFGSWVASRDVGQTMYWEGYNDGMKVYESPHVAGGTAAFLSTEWAEVDEVRFVSSSRNYFVLDDITYEVRDVVAVPAVPEPGTFALFGAGAAALGLMRRNRRRG